MQNYKHKFPDYPDMPSFVIKEVVVTAVERTFKINPGTLKDKILRKKTRLYFMKEIGKVGQTIIVSSSKVRK